MKKSVHKRSITPADKVAALRLKMLWDAKLRAERPTQEAMAAKLGGSSQSLASQYINGKIALNYKALLAFSEALGCFPEAIRDDLPEQALSKRSGASQSVRGHAGIINTRRESLGLSAAQVHQRLMQYGWPDGTPPPALETVVSWFSGSGRPRDMHYLRALYEVLEMDVEQASTGDPVEARTGLSQELLREFERMTVAQQEAMLLFVRQQPKGKP